MHYPYTQIRTIYYAYTYHILYTISRDVIFVIHENSILNSSYKQYRYYDPNAVKLLISRHLICVHLPLPDGHNPNISLKRSIYYV